MEGSPKGGSRGGSSPPAKPIDWGYVYSELRYALGYTTEQIDALTWGDYVDLCNYWKIHPPTHILAAAFMGYKPKQEVAEDNQDLAWEQLLAMFPVKIVPKEDFPQVG